MSVPSEPGVYPNVPFEKYVTIKAVNNSSLAAMRKSPAHYKAAQQIDRDSDALRFGRFLHDSTLEPSRLGQFYCVRPDLTVGIESKAPWSTNEYKRRKAEFEVMAGDKEIVSQEWYQSTQLMLHRLYQHDRARAWLCSQGPTEVTVIWDEPTTGIRCKVRFDKWDQGANIVPDIKTTEDCTDFNRSIAKFGYHRQAAFYVDAAYAITGSRHQFALIAIEKAEPYACRAALLDDDSICAGRDEYRSSLLRLKECLETDTWPGPEDPNLWRCPDWALTA